METIERRYSPPKKCVLAAFAWRQSAYLMVPFWWHTYYKALNISFIQSFFFSRLLLSLLSCLLLFAGRRGRLFSSPVKVYCLRLIIKKADRSVVVIQSGIIFLLYLSFYLLQRQSSWCGYRYTTACVHHQKSWMLKMRIIFHIYPQKWQRGIFIQVYSYYYLENCLL